MARILAVGMRSTVIAGKKNHDRSQVQLALILIYPRKLTAGSPENDSLPKFGISSSVHFPVPC